LPDEIGRLTALTYFGLNRNLIEALPSSIGNLGNLEVLELWDNELETIPDEITKCTKLKVLELRGILFSDENICGWNIASRYQSVSLAKLQLQKLIFTNTLFRTSNPRLLTNLFLPADNNSWRHIPVRCRRTDKRLHLIHTFDQTIINSQFHFKLFEC